MNVHDEEMLISTPSVSIDTKVKTATNPDSPLSKLHRRLRGRYLWAALLALIGMSGGAYIGWKATAPIYQSTGLIYIAPSMPSPQDPTAVQELPRFAGFVKFHVQNLRSMRTIQLAMETKTWKAMGGGVGPGAVQGFLKRRQIIHLPGTHHIQILFEHENPNVAVAGVASIVEVYRKLEDEFNSEDTRLSRARRKTGALADSIKSLEDDVQEYVGEYGGVDGLTAEYQGAVEQVIELETHRMNAVSARRRFTKKVEDNEPPRTLTADEIAIESESLANLLLDLELLRADERVLVRRLGEKNDKLVELRDQIAVRQNRIEKFTKNWNARRVAAWERARTLAGTGQTSAALDRRVEEATKAVELARKQRNKLGLLRAEVRRLQAQSERLAPEHRRWSDLEEQLTSLVIESERIVYPDEPTRPTVPARDRRKAYAAFGGAIGAFLGLLIVLLVGLFDPRMKSVGDVGHDLSRLRLLGLMPVIRGALSRRGESDAAEHCAHQIRTMLQIVHADEPAGACICVTGPGVGSGKTSVTTALGLSYARSGSRTLLVDADLTGRGLTRQVCEMLVGRLRRLDAVDDTDTPSSELLLAPLAQTSPDWPTIEEIWAVFERAIDRTGLQEACDAGIITETFSLAELLHRRVGRDHLAELFADKLTSIGESPSEWIPERVLQLERQRSEFNGAPLDRYLCPTGIDGMRLLPLRSLGRGGTVSVRTVSRILQRIRKDFDVALIDTGPVPGAVESSMVAMHAESVVLVLSPGDRKPDAERAVAHLDDIGAKIAGVVLNRAGRKDMFRASRSTSLSRTPQELED